MCRLCLCLCLCLCRERLTLSQTLQHARSHGTLQPVLVCVGQHRYLGNEMVGEGVRHRVLRVLRYGDMYSRACRAMRQGFEIRCNTWKFRTQVLDRLCVGRIVLPPIIRTDLDLLRHLRCLCGPQRHPVRQETGPS